MMRNVTNVPYELSPKPSQHTSHVFYKVAIFILLFGENVIYMGACSTFPFSTVRVCLQFFMSRKWFHSAPTYCKACAIYAIKYFFFTSKLISSIFHGVFHSSFNSLSLTHQLPLFDSAAVLMLREMGRKQAKLLLQCFMFNATHFESIQPMCVMSCVIKTPERQSLNCETTGCERAIICTIHVQIKKFWNFFPS